MGVSPNMVRAIVRGEKGFPMNRIEAVAKFYELSIDELIARSKVLAEQREAQLVSTDSQASTSSDVQKEAAPQRKKRTKPAAVGRRRASSE